MQFSASWRLLGRGSNNEGDGCEIWVMSEGEIWDQRRNMYQSRRVVGQGEGRNGEKVKDSSGVRLGMK